MSALTVIFRLNKTPVEHVEMERMLDSLKHRGSDDKGIYIETNVGLGHRMRWVTPESLNEILPAASANSSCVITCDARIDNRDELIQQLALSKGPNGAITDSEIIMHAYDKWGNGCAEKLVGDFVFAIWDSKLQKIFCARDSMGVKHFYYFYKPNHLFAIASEIKALLCLSDIPKELNVASIGDMLILNHQDKESTPFKGIKRLPANHAMEVNASKFRIWEYWRPVPGGKFRFKSSRDFEDEFRTIFSEAVTCRLRSVRSAGSLLSGGLDSSSISCIASRHLERNGKPPLETFSAVFPTIAATDPRIDERHFIDTVVQHINCTPKYVEADSFSPFQDLDELQWHADHPVAAPNVFMDWALFKAARQRDVGVLLSGFDGDSTVSYGYEAFGSLARQGKWWRLYKDAAALNTNMPGKHHSLKNLVLKQGFAEAAPDVFRQAWRVVNGRPRILKKDLRLPASMNFQYENMKAQFAAEQDLKQRYFAALAKTHPDGVSTAESHWNGLSSGIFAFALESFEKMGAAFEIEPRFPFFDRRLIEFCISLPANQKVYKGWTRSILRRAMNNILPTAVQWRTDKANIGLSYKMNMLKYGSETVEKTLFGTSNGLEEFIEKESLWKAFERYRSDPLKNGKEALLIISAVYISRWLSRYHSAPAGRFVQ